MTAPPAVSANPWSSIGPEGGNIHALAVDPLTPSTLYAGTDGGLFKSTDGGGTWTVIIAGAAIYGIGIDPQTPSRLYVGTDVSGGQVSRSTDGGMTWTAIAPYQASSIVVDPVTPTRIYVGAPAGVFKSTDGGDTWINKNTNGGGVIAIDPLNPSRLYLASYFGLYTSTNGGDDWSTIWTLATSTILIDPTNPSTIYADWSKSTDGGANWTSLLPLVYQEARTVALDPATPSTLYALPGQDVAGGVLKSTDGGATWATTGLSKMINTLAIDPANPATLYAGAFLRDGTRDAGGIFKSSDGGESWSAANTGLTALSIDTIAVDPTDPSTIYVGSISGGVLKTSDGGAHWTASNTGLSERTAIVQLAVDPVQPATVYAACMRGYLSPGSGLFKSTDGAATWSATGVTSGVWQIVVDPLQPSILFVMNADGVSKSTDGGATWSTASICTNPYCGPIAIDPSDDSILYASTGSGLLKSSDGGATWGPTALTYFVPALVIDPTDTKRIYAQGYDQRIIFVSSDGGASWMSSTIPAARWVTELLSDPSMPLSLYAAGDGLMRTTDGGASWLDLSAGLPFPAVSAPAVSALAIGGSGPLANLYAAPFASSIFVRRTGCTADAECGLIACSTASCDQDSGVCSQATMPDGTTCSDGVACMADGTCSSGVCLGQLPDASACTSNRVSSGAARTDCMHEWFVLAGSTIVNRTRSQLWCRDDDPACDAGTTLFDDACTFRVALCFNNVDSQLSSCTPTDVQRVDILGSRSTRDTTQEANRTALASAMAGLGGSAHGVCTNAGAPSAVVCQADSDCDSIPGAGDGHCQFRSVAFSPPLTTQNSCTELASIRVPLRVTKTGSRRKGVKRLVIRTVSSNGSSSYDVDRLKLMCQPR